MASPPVTQPSIQAGNLVMLSIGIVCNADRMEIVFPAGYDTGVDDVNFQCESAVSAAQTNLIPLIAPLLSSDAYISFTQATGVCDGLVPYRLGYGPTVFPGTGSAGAVSSQVAGMLFFYEDAGDRPVHTPNPIRLGKNSIPGIATDALVGDIVTSGWHTAAVALANQMQLGFEDTVVFPGTKWYRFLAKPPGTHIDPGANVRRVFINGAREYVVTQRRRLIPR